MDSFTRNYSIVLAGIVIALLVWWLSSVWQPRVWEINGFLEEDATLAEYPYAFRLRSLDDGVATLWSPRNFQVPAIRFLGVIHPELAGLGQDDPKVVAAQQDLIEHQKHAQALVLSQPDVERVDWALDVQWLADHGVQVNAG
jgi:hypothetical protein